MVLLFPILEKQQQQQTLSLSSPLHLCINSQKNSMPLLLRPREWSPSRCLTSPLRWNGSCQGHRSYCAVTESVSPPRLHPAWSTRSVSRLTPRFLKPQLHCSSSFSSAGPFAAAPLLSQTLDLRCYVRTSLQSLLPHPFIFHRCYPVKPLEFLTLSRHALPRGPAPMEPPSPESKPQALALTAINLPPGLPASGRASSFPYQPVLHVEVKGILLKQVLAWQTSAQNPPVTFLHT